MLFLPTRAALLTFAAFFISEAQAQAPCPPAFDQLNRFTSADFQTATLDIVGATAAAMALRWPSYQQLVDSALLWLNVKAGADAALVVRLSSGDIVSEQTFMAGSMGMRALNASAFTKLPAGQALYVTLSNGGLRSSQGILHLFRNRMAADNTVLVVAPHPDDAEIAAFGFYADHKSTVVTITSGNAGDFNYCQVAPDAATHYRLKGELRVIDSVTVPWQGGVPVSRAFNLGYFDGTLQTMYADPAIPAKELFIDNDDVFPYRRLNQAPLLRIANRKATWKNLVADLQTVLARVRPAVVVTPDPRLDSHLDHQFTTVALSHALAKTKLQPKILLYTNHADADRYPMGGTGQDVPLPPWCAAEPLVASAFFAHPLPATLQRRKLMALESMHDLRLAPSAQYEFGPNPDTRCHTHPGATLDSVSYFRRGVRSHEVFLVTDRSGLQTLVQSFADADTAAQSARQPLPAQQP